ncbi:MAG: DUF4832 domain-containing protein [Planctomycetia bacterium]|nr:DUF4832 domain-containing protein [Planctomycetia bacterium]
MKKLSLVRNGLILFLLFFLFASGLFAQEYQTNSYHGIRPTDPEGRIGLRNPERGWRTETKFAELPGTPFKFAASHVLKRLPKVYDPDLWILDAQRHAPYGLTIVQTYCYLDTWRDKPLPQEKLDWLQREFDALRACGLKSLLRFAYEYGDMKNGAKPERILQHMEQLAPIIRKNIDVIYVMQAGFIGAWGEWHSATYIPMDDLKSRATILKRVLEILPEGRMTQVRVPKYKSSILKSDVFNAFEEVTEKTAFSNRPAARIGFNNDGFLAGRSDGGTWPEGPLFGSPGNPQFDYMTREAPYVAVDGELFWADLGYDGHNPRKKGVDGLLAALRLREHHYTTFSIAHSYSVREGQNFSIDYWLSAPITKEELTTHNMPIADGWFEDNFGKPVERTQFEYITDHLGYRLELREATLTKSMKTNQKFKATFKLINRGFAVVINPRTVYVTFVDQAGNVFSVKTNARVQDWQPYKPGDKQFTPLTHTIAIESALPQGMKPGWYKIGLWLPDASDSIRFNSQYAIRLANRDTFWWTKTSSDNGHSQYGINIVGSVEVQE